jgi:hypothetical protein
MPRQLRPRQPVAVAAAYVSQLTCLQLLGIDARRYLETVVPRCKGDVVPLGKLRLVPLDVAVLRLRELAASDDDEHRGVAADASEVDVEAEDDQPTSVDAVLRRLGKERVAC